MLKIQVKEIILILIFAIVVVASGTDLLAYLSHGASVKHVTKETVIVTISVNEIAWLLLGLRRQTHEITL